MGGLCYADDLVLLAPSVSALRMMLSICGTFALSHGLKFNSQKTQLIRFNKHIPSSHCNATISFCGSNLNFSDQVIHLGHILQYNLNDEADIVRATKDLL